MLQSDNHNKRYDACEELRVLPSLPPEALEALRLATNDPNPGVADAAQRALALHTPKLTPEDVKENNQNEAISNNRELSSKTLFIFSASISLISSFFLYDLLSYATIQLLVPTALVLFILGLIISKLAKSKRWKNLWSIVSGVGLGLCIPYIFWISHILIFGMP